MKEYDQQIYECYILKIIVKFAEKHKYKIFSCQEI